LSQIITPGSVNLQAQVIDAPNASPATVTMQGDGKVMVCIVGGLTKLESGAMQIAAGLAAHGYFEPKECAERSVDIASEVLKAAKHKEQQLAAKVA
jgi:hypothetical protein